MKYFPDHTISRFYLPISILISLVVLVVYYGMILYFGVNIPYWDEYGITLEFLKKYEEAELTSGKLSLLYSLSNEHRIVIYHLLLLLEKSIFGNIDFLRMMIIGNTGVLFIWSLLWKSIKIEKHKLLYFLPVTLLLFVCVWERSTWACAAFLNTYVFLFGFCSLYFLSKNGTKNLILAIVCAVLSTYSFGNGLFVFPVGFLVLWVMERSKKDYLIWGTTFVVVGLLYFLNYAKPISQSASVLNTNPILFVGYISAFLGAVFKYITPYLAPFAGFTLLIITLTVFLLHFKDRKKHVLLWSYLVFLGATVFVAAVSRSGLGLGQAISYRYELIPSLVMAILYLFFLKITPKKTTLLFTLMLAGLLYAGRVHHNAKECGYLKERLESGLIMHHAGDPFKLSGIFEQRKQLGKTLEQSISSGLYNSPINKLAALPKYQEIPTLPESSQRVHTKLYINKNSEQFLFLKGWAYVNGLQTHDADIQLTLHSPDGQTFAFQTTPVMNRYLTEQYGYGYYLDKAGFKIILDKSQLTMLPEEGRYEVGFLINNGEKYFYKRFKDIDFNKM